MLEEVDTVNLKAKVTSAWQDFTRALATLLPTLPPGARLDVTLDPTATGTGNAVYEVNVTVGEHGEFTGHAVGNANLPMGYRLERSAVAEMVELGWLPPGVVEGSEGNFGLQVEATDVEKIAALVGRTMRLIYGAPHPAFLTYTIRALGDSEVPVDALPLGTARPAPTLAEVPLPDQRAVLSEAMAATIKLPLPDKVRTIVAALLKTDPDKLDTDPEGEIGVRAGSSMVFVKVHEDPAIVDVYSPVLTEVNPQPKLYERLAELTRRMPIGRLYCTDKTVWASIPVIGRDFQAAHLVLALQVMMGLVDELDDRLHGEFGGKRFFEPETSPSAEEESERTGMYL